MPYIVTTKRQSYPATRGANGTIVTSIDRRAVATLEAIPKQDWRLTLDDVRALPESGGTISLPDGTVIEVEQTTGRALFDSLPMDEQRRLPTWPLPTLRMVIDAFNARGATR